MNQDTYFCVLYQDGVSENGHCILRIGGVFDRYQEALDEADRLYAQDKDYVCVQKRTTMAEIGEPSKTG